MKKILLLSPAHPLRGGIASSTHRLAEELQKHHHEVVIYSFSLQYPSILFPGKTQYTDDPPPKGLKIKTLINSISPLNWWQVGRKARKEKADLIIVRYWLPFMGPSLGSILRLAKAKSNTKVIAIADNVIPHEKRIGDKQFTQYFLNPVDGFIVMSRSVKSDIRQFTDVKPVRYIPHPIYDNYGEIISREEALSFLSLPEEPKYLLFFGFIRDYKGLDLLLEAMTDPIIRSKGIKLIVAGEFYSKPEKYETFIAAHDLGEVVILKNDFIPHEAVKYYFGASDLVVQPYKSATQSGISQLAYHFEKPMVVTKVGGLPEIVPHGEVGYVVDINKNAIAEAIVDFFDHNRSEMMTKKVKENKARFSWENMVKGIKEMYNGF